MLVGFTANGAGVENLLHVSYDFRAILPRAATRGTGTRGTSKA